MDGIINFHKPPGITSAKALYRVRAITKERKSGHTGTLDPAAVGVLVLCLGKATKLVESVIDLPKVYRTTARLDVTSESFDSDRTLTPVPVADIPSLESVLAACTGLEGVIEQVPPAISAIKIDGQPSYKRRADQQSFELAPRPVTVHWIHVHSYAWPTIDFEVCCGRGTYVRALIRDMGVRLGAGGCLASLTRTRVGPFSVEDAWTLDALASAKGVAEYLIELDRGRAIIEASKGIVPLRPSSPSLLQEPRCTTNACESVS